MLRGLFFSIGRSANTTNLQQPMKFINLTKSAPSHLNTEVPPSMPLKKAEALLTESERAFCEKQEVSGVEDTLTNLKHR